MRPTLKKLEVKEIGDLEKLVAENVEGIEPGLKVIDSRLLLGHAAIDLVGLDAKGSLVLIALDFTADEGLLLRVMDAYSWCLEYPDTIRRLYPTAQVSAGRPPRILFIVERLTDPFMRRIKQLSFLEIDCLEFRHLEVNGASALYFDLVQRLRRSETAELAGSPAKAPIVAAEAVVAVPAPVAPAAVVARPVAASPVTRAVVTVASVAPVIEPPRPVTPPPAASPERPMPEPEVTLDARAAEMVHEAAASADEQRHIEAEAQMVQGPATQEAPPAPVLDAAGNPEWQALLDDLGVETPGGPGAAAAESVMPVIEAEVTAAEEPDEAATEREPRAEAVAAQAQAARPTSVVQPPVQPTPAWAKPAERPVQPGAGRTYFFAQAVKGTAPGEPQAAPPAPAATTPGAEATTPNRPELDSLNFPKDGLSRQWLEFLNQLSAK